MEKFNPQNPEYKKVEDLPKEERSKFKDVENGFVRKTAIEDLTKAQAIAKTKLVQKNYKKISKFRENGMEDEAKVLTENLESEIKKLEE